MTWKISITAQLVASCQVKSSWLFIPTSKIGRASEDRWFEGLTGMINDLLISDPITTLHFQITSIHRLFTCRADLEQRTEVLQWWMARFWDDSHRSFLLSGCKSNPTASNAIDDEARTFFKFYEHFEWITMDLFGCLDSSLSPAFITSFLCRPRHWLCPTSHINSCGFLVF